ncbi:MAG: GIY-YIG nuclease family protein [Parvibaculum sp.]|nr:GIY-YIG nuclease family protein [Parvibaculum sp.]
MIVDKLSPTPTQSETFRRSRLRFVPAVPGCYVLVTPSKEVLYLGLSKDLRSRMNSHLENEQKTAQTRIGRATLFYWFETTDMERVERSWMNVHFQHEGMLPILNRIYSPTQS